MTPAQLSTLKTSIAADATLNALPNTGEGPSTITAAYNLPAASPTFTVWRTNVSAKELGDNFVGTDLSGLSTLNHTRLQTVIMISQDGFNASLPDRRAMLDDIFSGAGGAATRARLLILYKRLATRAEKLYANTSQGAGTDAAPATLTFEGQITDADVRTARDT